MYFYSEISICEIQRGVYDKKIYVRREKEREIFLKEKKNYTTRGIVSVVRFEGTINFVEKERGGQSMALSVVMSCIPSL